MDETLGLELDLADVVEVGHDHGARAEERLEVFGQLRAARVAWVHGDEGADGGHQRDGLVVEDEIELLATYRVEYCRELPRHNRKYLDRDPVELVEASPSAGLREAREDRSHGLVVHLVRAVLHNDPDGERAAKVLGGLGLTGARRSRGRAAQHEPQRLRECDVAAVGQRGDD
eukprot:2893899-Pleurochrysis_carterae.AAC.3